MSVNERPIVMIRQLSVIDCFPVCYNGRPTAIFPEMERLPEQHGVVLQTPEEREELHGRNTCLRRTDV